MKPLNNHTYGLSLEQDNSVTTTIGFRLSEEGESVKNQADFWNQKKRINLKKTLLPNY